MELREEAVELAEVVSHIGVTCPRVSQRFVLGRCQYGSGAPFHRLSHRLGGGICVKLEVWVYALGPSIYDDIADQEHRYRKEAHDDHGDANTDRQAIRNDG